MYAVCSACNPETVCPGLGPRHLRTSANVLFGPGYLQKPFPKRPEAPEEMDQGLPWLPAKKTEAWGKPLGWLLFCPHGGLWSELDPGM